jgi:PhoH-like ATPase
LHGRSVAWIRREIKREPGGRAGLSHSPAPPVKKPYELLMEQGILEIEALCYIRGRSIPNRFFILDEAQQLTRARPKPLSPGCPAIPSW